MIFVWEWKLIENLVKLKLEWNGIKLVDSLEGLVDMGLMKLDWRKM